VADVSIMLGMLILIVHALFKKQESVTEETAAEEPQV
jgi:lipoprotein signal peptidase